MQDLRIMLCDLTHSNKILASDSVPLGIGMLAAYAQSFLGSGYIFELYKEPHSLDRDLEEFSPDIVGFSNYLWNERISLSFARYVKDTHPSVITIFGGPNYPLDIAEQQEYLGSHPEIDFYLPHDAEISFSSLIKIIREKAGALDLIRTGKPLDGVHYMYRDKIIAGPAAKRAPVSDIPSPYLLGLFDKFLNQHWEPLVITARGCPFKCTFCVEGQDYYSKVYSRDVREVREELIYIAKKLQGTEARLLFADSNFGMYKSNIEVAKVVEECRETYGWPSYVTITGGKNKKERVLEAVKFLGKRTSMTFDIQSSDSEVLEAVGRKNVSLAAIVETSNELERMDMGSYSGIILGLPLDTKERFLKSVKDLIAARIKKVVVFSLMILPGARLGDMNQRQEFGFDINYRVLPRSYGLYRWGQENYPITEIEKVAVGNKTLTKDDYLFCREFSLILTIFYNDRILQPLLNVLEAQGIDIFDFVCYLHENLTEAPRDLTDFIAELQNDIRVELFETVDDALKHFRRNVDDYLCEASGRNIFHKTMAEGWLNHFDSIIEFAFSCANKLLINKKGAVSEDIVEFINQSKKFIKLRSKEFMNPSRVFDDQFDFDPKQLKNGQYVKDSRKRDRVFRVTFKHTIEQQEFIKARHREAKGSSAGMGRVLTSTNIEALFRVPYAESGEEMQVVS